MGDKIERTDEGQRSYDIAAFAAEVEKAAQAGMRKLWLEQRGYTEDDYRTLCDWFDR